MALEFTYIILDAHDHPVRDPDNHDPIQFSTWDDAENAIVEKAVGRGARIIAFTDWIDTVSELN